MTKLPEPTLSREVGDMNQPSMGPSRRYRYYVLGVLVLVYTMNFLDRQILGILAASIKKELVLTDTQLGLMGGLAFGVVYSTLSIPIAWLADRSSRRSIIAWSLGIWSAFTALCGFASSFWHLFAARLGVGFGEAGGVAPSYSIISDYFPKEQRARALSIYSLGIPLGSGAGLLFGGLIAAHLDWRYAFMIVGAAGVVVAPLLRATVKDPPRGGWTAAATTAAAPKAPAFSVVLGTVVRKKTFWLMALGAAFSSMCGYGVAFWLPSYFQRSMGLSLPDTSWYLGAITFFGGCLGILGGGMLADRLGVRSKSSYPKIPAVAFLLALPFFLVALNTSSLYVLFPILLIPTALNLVWLGPILTAVQHLVPAQMRTTASAMFLLINNLLGFAVGFYYFGAVSDALAPTYGVDSLRYALCTGAAFYVVAAVLFLAAGKTIKKDWVE
jgi:MFS family permease